MADVADKVLEKLAKIEEKQAAQDKKLEDLTKSATSSRESPFGLPNIRSGEDSMTSRGYSVLRAIGCSANQIPADRCKVEMELSNKIKKSYLNQGYKRSFSNSLFIPFSAELFANSQEDESLSREVGDLVKAGVHGYDPGEVAHYRQKYWGREKALSWIEGAGHDVVAPPMQGELIELLRNNEILMQAGARMIAMPPNGRIVWPKQSGAGTAYWVGENSTITESDANTGNVILQAKKLGIIEKIPNELFHFASISIEQFVREDMARVMALKMDKTFLDSIGSALEPKGIVSYSGITSHDATTVDTNGNTYGVDDPAEMIGKVEEKNAIFRAFIMRPLMYTALSNRRADAVTAADGKGQFLFNMWRTLQEEYIDPRRLTVGNLNGYPVFKSTQVSNTRVKGSGTNLTYILGGDFTDFLIALSGVMEFLVSNQTTGAFTDDQTWYRGILHCDGAPRHEESFILCDSLLVA